MSKKNALSDNFLGGKLSTWWITRGSDSSECGMVGQWTIQDLSGSETTIPGVKQPGLGGELATWQSIHELWLNNIQTGIDVMRLWLHFVLQILLWLLWHVPNTRFGKCHSCSVDYKIQNRTRATIRMLMKFLSSTFTSDWQVQFMIRIFVIACLFSFSSSA